MKKLINEFKKILDKFQLTCLTSILTSIVYAITSNNTNDIIKMIITFLITFCITSFLTETLFDTNKNKKFYLLPLTIGSIFVLIENSYFDISYIFFNRLQIFYYASIILLGIYFNYKKTKQSFSKYSISCFSNLLKVGIIYMVLIIGIILIFVLIDCLIINNILTDAMDYVLILLTGGYLVPASIFAINKYEEVNNFIITLVTKILFIMLVTAYLIVYIYMFKIFITSTIPSNTIFRILSALFIASTIINVMGMDNEKNKLLTKIHKILPYLFIPFIILQCYSLGVRILNNGLTISRYLGIACIIFEIVYTIFHIIKKDEGLLTYVIIIELFISLIVPFINCYDLSITNQYKYLIEYKETNKITTKTIGAYNYLINYEKGRNLIDKNLTESEKTKLIKNIDQESKSYYYNNEDENISVEGYKNFKIVIENSDKKTNYPMIKEKIKNCINGNKQDCFEKNNTIEIENKKIIIKRADCYYEKNKITLYNVEYYLLTK